VIRPIVTWPDPVLTTPAAPEDRLGTKELRELIADMWETMYAAPGVGLAAPQIGVARRVAVIDSTTQDNGKIFELVNPVITARGPLVEYPQEGCLSVPGEWHGTKRHATVTVEYLTLEGEPQRFEAEGFTAIVIQHEVDHLEGRLYVDLLGALARSLIRRRMIKKKSEGG
jgi:peptide deformylase